MARRINAGILADTSISGMARIALLAGAIVAGGTGTARASAAWPQLPVPMDVDTFDMGEQVTVNGVPMRMLGFTSPHAPGQVAGQFRESLGKPLVENTLGSALVLGGARGEHYLTVQLQSSGKGTRGVIGMSSLTGAMAKRETTRVLDHHFLSRMAPASILVSRTGSIDGKSRSQHLVFTNAHSVELNIRYVKNMLESSGFAFEGDTLPAQSQGALRSARSHERKTLFFKAKGGEAIAVIFRDGGNGTAVVLNTISYVEQTK